MKKIDYWKNQYGYYDPTLAEVIKKENTEERKHKKLQKDKGGNSKCKK